LSDYAVSSYIPTVAVLTERVKSTRTVPEEKSGLLLVSQPNAPGFPSIPGTTTEIERIAQTINESQANIRTLRLEDDKATVQAGTEGMESYSCVHLACHAAQNSEEPLKSGFYLHDGRLELSTIMKSHIKSADFAFLSACQTSTGDHKLSEEAVHLAAGMLAAGYRSVVATMWSIQDEYAPEVAEDFYADLLRRGCGLGRNTIDGSNAAYSLHRAVRNLRERHGDSDALFLAWIPYVHFGF
jgi:CHAT domain-containing protein